MSRFRLEPRAIGDNPDMEVYVGWDEGLRTYFAQVFTGLDPVTGEDRLELDLGSVHAEFENPSAVVDALRPYAVVPDDLDKVLVSSQDSASWGFADLRQNKIPTSSEQLVEELAKQHASMEGQRADDEDLGAEEHASLGTEHRNADDDLVDDSLSDSQDLSHGLGY